MTRETFILKIVNEITKKKIFIRSGQERFCSLSKSYYRNSSIVFLFYDVNKTVEESNKSVNENLLEYEKHKEEENFNKKSYICVKMQIYCYQKKFDHFICSSKTGEGIKEIIEISAKNALMNLGKIVMEKELQNPIHSTIWTKEEHFCFPIKQKMRIETVFFIYSILRKKLSQNSSQKTNLWNLPKPILFEILSLIPTNPQNSIPQKSSNYFNCYIKHSTKKKKINFYKKKNK